MISARAGLDGTRDRVGGVSCIGDQLANDAG
jgi:hypothetical protein